MKATCLVFIYLPCVNVICSLYGPTVAGHIGLIWAVLILLLSFSVFVPMAFLVESYIPETIFWFLTFISLGIIINSLVNLKGRFQKLKLNNNIGKILVFPILVAFSPAIFILIKLLAAVKTNNKLIVHQNRWCLTGESVLEATPQLCLQLYIALREDFQN